MDRYNNPYADLISKIDMIHDRTECVDDRQVLVQAINALERLAKRVQQLELENKVG
jgi:BMFP domain-containing protein YqiC